MDEIGPVVPKEAEWVRHREDMITLRCGREHAWLDCGIEHLLKFLQQKLGAKSIVEVSGSFHACFLIAQLFVGLCLAIVLWIS